MSTWIHAYQSLLGHPKTKRLMRTLSTSPNETLGILMRLWWFAMEYAPDGGLGDFAPEDIAEAVGWEGDPAALVAGLQNPGPNKDAHGFLDGLTVHDWEDYGGKLYTRREQDAERKRQDRQRDKVPPSNGCPTDVGRTAYVEEKRGEEKREERVKAAGAGEKPVENPGHGHLADAEDALRTVTGYPFDPKKDRGRLRDLDQAFLEVDLAHEIRKWGSWLEDQKAKKPTWKPNYRLSLLNWVEKAAEIRRRDAPANGNGHAPPSTLVRPETVARLRAMVAQGDNPEDLRGMCASEAEWLAVTA